ncbi:MAG: hypothetical protein OHK0022_18590 [Roseiflexaceae bacterium]
MSDKQRWLIFSPLGLVLVGLGVSVVGDAVARKSQGEPWFVRGTLGLSLLNAGLSVFGDAVKARVLYELGQR